MLSELFDYGENEHQSYLMLQTVVKWKGNFISKIKSSWKHKMSRKENGIKHL